MILLALKIAVCVAVGIVALQFLVPLIWGLILVGICVAGLAFVALCSLPGAIRRFWFRHFPRGIANE